MIYLTCLLVTLILTTSCLPRPTQQESVSNKPNIVLILADDLAYGDVSAFFQDQVQTPHLDRMAANGMRFTQHYTVHSKYPGK